MPEPLDGAVAWITGAGSGLGHATAVAFHAAGAAVALTGRTSGPLQALAAELDGIGPRAIAVSGSVADPTFVRTAVDRIVAELGDLNALVNMAGVNPTVERSERLSDADWHNVIDINLTGTFTCCREAGRHMVSRGQGSILNVSSVHGSTGVPRMAAYCASKGGVEALTKALAVEWAPHGVRVNCLAPGYFRTAMTDRYLDRHGDAIRAATPLGRAGEPHELAAMAVLLGSPDSGFTTGAVVAVDGGWTAR